MSRFIFRFLVLALIAVVFIGGVYYFEVGWQLLKYYKYELIMPESASIVFLGDSQLDMGIDSAVDSRFFNFSAHGRQMDQSYLSLLDLFKANGDAIKVVVLDVSPVSMATDYEIPVADIPYASCFYLLHILHPVENTRSLSGIIGVARDYMVGKRWRNLTRALRGALEFKSSLYGGFMPRKGVLQRDNLSYYNTLQDVKIGLCAGFERQGPDSPVFIHIDRIIRLADSYGAKVVIMSMPWKDDLRARVGQNKIDHFSEVVRTYASWRNIPYLNYINEQIPWAEWYDGVHLNDAGAQQFTKKLSKLDLWNEICR